MFSTDEVSVKNIKVGDRCQIAPGKRRGSIAWIGKGKERDTNVEEEKIALRPGYWVGIKFDEPVGRNDGTLHGRKYFECESKFGSFVRPDKVTIGDFPEQDYDNLIFSSSSDEEYIQ